MDYNTSRSIICETLLNMDGNFDMNKVIEIAFHNAPDGISELEIKLLALNIVEEMLNVGMLRMGVDEKNQKIIYKSDFAKENDEKTESVAIEPQVEK